MMLYTWYGDDFTGSTDVLETLALAGVEAALFLAPPTPARLGQFPGIQAIGIAGDSRSRSPEWMTHNLRDIYCTMRGFGAPLTHYKTCSTFDSAPHVGSIGRAIEIGREVFDTRFVPIVVGAPHLGRYVVFGNLFATANGIAYRIDHHPTMNRHPVTPMLEADLRKHLAWQTSLPIALIDLRSLSQETLNNALDGGAAAILFDTFDDTSIKVAGELVWNAAEATPIFGVGSSGLTKSMIPAWRSRGLIGEPREQIKAALVEQVLVVSGSCSPITEAQIEWAKSRGFVGIPLDADALIRQPEYPLATSVQAVQSGASPILYTAMGPLSGTDTPYAEELGKALGHLLRAVLNNTDIRRIVLCGGDTSSHAVQQLPIHALTWSASTSPGAPICRTHSDDLHFDGLELILKGGQVGPVDFFGTVRR